MQQKRSIIHYSWRGLLSAGLSFLLYACLVSSCTTATDSTPLPPTSSHQSLTVSYRHDSHALIMRTFVAGGVYGTLNLAPQISLYGDGTFIFGTQQQGQLTGAQLQSVLTTMLQTDGLLTFKRHQFSDLPDQNATFLELNVNDKPLELMYGSFGNQSESDQDLTEYHQLAHALTTLTESLTAPVHPYTSNQEALFVRRSFSPDPAHTRHYADTSLSLAQLADFECGPLPKDEDLNPEGNCLKYTIPEHAFIPDTQQLASIKNTLQNELHGELNEDELFYEVTLRPLLPDETDQKQVAMFGSAQNTYRAVPLQIGELPRS
ncbi:hypothetical protein [Tengunoibacter tsumagoiensis]|uniref:Lipoprotein n=1 Tax=Tengunoibacter tsumagoiensis TaxID=2014871 RepID=A0A401ZYE6_9CHLR|nr:hypothetical protein [Tengunoibacter tsumagoiensis]GCE11884.1 hypothetical protein KTT_17430 [Tengunoibacter tsumagoiensis]